MNAAKPDKRDARRRIDENVPSIARRRDVLVRVVKAKATPR